jgi:hypothetical protein
MIKSEIQPPRILTLRNVFYAMTTLIVGAKINVITLPFSIALLLYWAITLSSSRSPRFSIFWNAIVFWPIVLTLGLAIFIGDIFRNTSAPIICHENYRSLTLAMLNHESAYGQFPPAYVADADGKPMHSWRVAILPFMECDDLHAAYNFNEPWNSPANLKLVPKMPKVYQCPLHKHPGLTTYKIVTGPGSVFVDDHPPKFSDIPDGASNTVMMIEDFANPIPWTKPDDVSIEEAVDILTAKNTRQAFEKCAHHQDLAWAKYHSGTIVGFFDGSKNMIAIDSAPDDVRSMLLADDGNNIDWHELNSTDASTPYNIKWLGCALLCLYAALIFAPFQNYLRLEPLSQMTGGAY